MILLLVSKIYSNFSKIILFVAIFNATKFSNDNNKFLILPKGMKGNMKSCRMKIFCYLMYVLYNSSRH